MLPPPPAHPPPRPFVQPEFIPSPEEYEPVRPQKRTSASWSIQNKADAYMASLKGITVELPDDNPYLKEQLLEELPQRMPPPPPPKPPVGPKMSYAERLKLAKGGGTGGAVAAASPPASKAAVPAPVPVPESPVKPPPAAAAAAASVAGAQSAAPRNLLEQEVPESALLGEDATQAKVRRMD